MWRHVTQCDLIWRDVTRFKVWCDVMWCWDSRIREDLHGFYGLLLQYSASEDWTWLQPSPPNSKQSITPMHHSTFLEVLLPFMSYSLDVTWCCARRKGFRKSGFTLLSNRKMRHHCQAAVFQFPKLYSCLCLLLIFIAPFWMFLIRFWKDWLELKSFCKTD